MGTASLSLVVLKTRQVDNLVRFYTLVGVELAREQHARGPVHFAGHAGDVVLEIYPLPDDGSPVDATTRLGFAVANVAEVVQALRTIGASVDTEPRTTPWGLRAVVRDPDGRAVELNQQLGDAAMTRGDHAV